MMQSSHCKREFANGIQNWLAIKRSVSSITFLTPKTNPIWTQKIKIEKENRLGKLDKSVWQRWQSSLSVVFCYLHCWFGLITCQCKHFLTKARFYANIKTGNAKKITNEISEKLKYIKYIMVDCLRWIFKI